jgi:hypothetical protein
MAISIAPPPPAPPPDSVVPLPLFAPTKLNEAGTMS